MNRFYGIRLSDSFLSENRWYEINARSGKLMAGWAFAIIGVGLIGFVIPPETFPVYAVVATGIVLISVITPFFQIIRWARAMRS